MAEKRFLENRYKVMAAIKPTHKDPISPQSEKFEKDFKKTMIKTNAPAISESNLDEVNSMLSEVEQSLKKKIFSLAKMESLVFSDHKLSAVYEEMSENGEEKYGYHYNETIMNMLFNDYVLNSPKYLQKYKQAIPKEKKRRDKSGINQLKKQGEKKMGQSGLAKLEPTDTDESIEESTSAGSAGGAAGYTGYAGPSAFSTKGDLSGDFKGKKKKKETDPNAKPISTGFALKESNYLTDPSGFEAMFNELNESSSISQGDGSGYFDSPLGFKDDVKNVSKQLDTDKELKDLDTVRTVLPGQEKRAYGKHLPSGENVSSAIAQPEENKEVKKPYYKGGQITSPFKTGGEKVSGTVLAKHSQPERMNEEAKSKSQQRLMGMAYAYKQGKLDDEPSEEIIKLANSMSEKDLEDFASTKHKGLPNKVDEAIMTKSQLAEFAMNEVLSVHDTVEYVGDMSGENVFEMGGDRWQFVKGRYPDGKVDIAVYRFGHDLAYDYQKWMEAFNINENDIKENMTMKKYSITLQHDGGEHTINTTASDKEAAIQKVLKAEGAPRNAVTNVVEEPINEDTQSIIDNNGTSMSNKSQATGDMSSEVPMGAQQTGGMSEALGKISNELDEISTGLAQRAGQMAYNKYDDTDNDFISRQKHKNQYDTMISYVNPEIIKFLEPTGFNVNGVDGGVAIERFHDNEKIIQILVNPNGYHFNFGEEKWSQIIDQPTQRKIGQAIQRIQKDLNSGQQPAAGLNEADMKLLEDINNELEAFSIHHDKLKLMAEDKKTPSMVQGDRLRGENPKNFKKDLQHSGTKDIINVEKELQWKDQQTDVPKDPQKLGMDIEKQEIKNADMKGDEALKNVGDSTNDNGDEIPKRNLTSEEQKEVDLYRNGQHSLNYDNEPDKRFVDRMEADQGEFFEMGQKQKEFKADAPLYDKDTQPIDDGVDKVQFDKNVKKKGDKVAWNERMGIGSNVKLGESMVTGRYINDLGKSALIEFRLNEVKEVETIEEGIAVLNFAGLGNTYMSKTVDKKVVVNEGVVETINRDKFYTDGKQVFVVQTPTQSLNEGATIEEKPVMNEQMDKMKHLLGYKPESYVSTKGVKQNRKF